MEWSLNLGNVQFVHDYIIHVNTTQLLVYHSWVPYTQILTEQFVHEQITHVNTIIGSLPYMGPTHQSMVI